MTHQRQIEGLKYRNWVKGGLAYKYLKDGIEGFADEVVQQDHRRIVNGFKNGPASTCNQCSLDCLKPLHKRVYNSSTGKEKCPQGLNSCNCLFPRKQRCRNNVCDEIYEDILKSHGSTPPTPNWKNTNIQNWCSVPWEIAKCFINAPGYSDKMSAPDIDAPGLLHIFINNINFQSRVTRIDVFSKVLKRRNEIFHSPTMELEDKELNDCIDDIIAILEDDKELKARDDAQQAVIKLKQLKHDNFIITTYNEVDVCRAAMSSVVIKEAELKQLIQDTKADINANKADIESKQKDLFCSMDVKTQAALDGALEELSKQSDSKFKNVKQKVDLLEERVRQLELDNVTFKERLAEIEGHVERLDEARNICKIQIEYIEQKQALQKSLAELYLNHYVKTSVYPLKMQNNDIDINEVYVTPNMKITEKSIIKNAGGKIKSDTETIYSRDYKRDNESALRTETRDIFQTIDLRHQKIYIVGDVGTGKSSLAKMMIYNWCMGLTYDEKKIVQDENVKEMRFFDFLFFIPLQRMSGFSDDIPAMVRELYKDVAPNDLINRLFSQESERCLIVADGLDEWTPPKQIVRPLHISFGIPNRDGIQNATLITLARPSAKGILNLKSSECDLKIELSGVDEKSIREFTEKYMFKLQKGKTCIDGFMQKVRQANLQHLQKTPLLLQQLIWMYCTEGQLGNSVSDIYSNILNGMLCWSEKKGDENLSAVNNIPTEFEDMQLPEHLKIYPRCEKNKRFIFHVGKVAFESYIEDTWSSTFSRSKLMKSGLSNDDIAMLIRIGILVEYNSFDPKFDDTFLSFIHISYLEYCAAVYISSRYDVEQTKESNKRRVLEELVQKFTSIADILQLSNLLKFVCGLSPYLITNISKVVSEIAKNDEKMIRYRNSLRHQYNLSIPDETIREPEHVQRLLYNCLSESGRVDRPEISLCDVSFSYRSSKDFIGLINPNDILSVYIEVYSTQAIEEITKLIAHLTHVQSILFHIKKIFIFYRQNYSLTFSHLRSVKHLTLINLRNCHNFDFYVSDQLQSLHIESCQFAICSVENSGSLKDIYISDSKSDQESCEKLCTFLSEATTLERIELKRLYCDRKDCSGHTMDLSKHKNCQTIHLESILWIADLIVCPKRKLKEEGEKSLEPLSETMSLKQITLKDVGMHEHRKIDLSNQELLQSIYFENCSFVPGSLVNTTNLRDIYISGDRYEQDGKHEIWDIWKQSDIYVFSGDRYKYDAKHKIWKHEICENLSSSLLYEVSLIRLRLENIKCFCSDCIGRAIDFSNHNLLQSIHFEKCSFVPDFLVNTTNLNDIYISGDPYGHDGKHEICEKLSSSLLYVVSLTHLTLKNMKCFCSNCRSRAIDFSNHGKLRSIHFDDVSIKPICPKALTELSIRSSTDLRTNHKLCEQLLSSIPAALQKLKLKGIRCDKWDCNGHILDLTQLHQLSSFDTDDISIHNDHSSIGNIHVF